MYSVCGNRCRRAAQHDRDETPLPRVQVGRVVESFTLRLTPPAPILDNETLVMGAIASDNASDTWAVAILELRLIYDWSGARSVYLDMLNTTLWSSRGGYARAKPDIARAPFHRRAVSVGHESARHARYAARVPHVLFRGG